MSKAEQGSYGLWKSSWPIFMHFHWFQANDIYGRFCLLAGLSNSRTSFSISFGWLGAIPMPLSIGWNTFTCQGFSHMDLKPKDLGGRLPWEYIWKRQVVCGEVHGHRISTMESRGLT